MTDRMKSFVKGILLGEVGTPLPRGKEPVAYLYNGVRLPPLPDYDKSKYPFARIAKANAGGRIGFRASTTEYYAYQGNYGICIATQAVDILCFYYESTGQWSDLHENINMYEVLLHNDNWVWTNHDIKKDGVVLFKASDPVPVYE